MISLVGDRAFRHMFLAQAFSLIGSGVATVALGLLAYELVEGSASVVLGTALAIKMIAYVLFSPIAGAMAVKFSRRRYLIALDLVRSGLVLFLPFVDTVWQIYLIIFLLNTFTAGFSPVYQATIPDIVTDENDYVKALSLSRIAFNIESIASPVIAGLLMTFITFHWLFVVTSVGFMISAALIGTTVLPSRSIKSGAPPFLRRLTAGLNIYARTPRLCGLFALNLVLSLVGANVYVNSVIIAHVTLGRGEQTYLDMLLIFGVGSILGALALPFFFRHFQIRSLCVSAALAISIAPFAMLAGVYLPTILVIWAVIGACASLINTSGGLLLRASSNEADRPSVFAAQFSLSHACWLVAYPVSAWLGVAIGPIPALYVLAGISLLAVIAMLFLWPAKDPLSIYHEHSEYSHSHSPNHNDGHHQTEREIAADEEPHQHVHRHLKQKHAHPFVIDEHHQRWPKNGHLLVD